jgi:SAM-dependent methyltransferase
MLDLARILALQWILPQQLGRVPEPAPVMTGRDRCERFAVATHDEHLPAIYEFCGDILASFRLDRARALDLACGTGQFLFALANRFPAWRFEGLDASEDMLGICRDRSLEAAEPGRFRFFREDMADLSTIADHDYDVTTFTMSAHHTRDLDDLGRVLRNMVRITAPEGGILLMDLGRLKTASLNERYVRWASRDYDPDFVQDFRDSMAAAYTARELSDLVAGLAVPRMRHFAFPGLPTLQVVLRPATGGTGEYAASPPSSARIRDSRTFRDVRRAFGLCGLR